MTNPNQSSPVKRQHAILKLLAVAGLLGMLFLAGYAAIQAVRYAPTGFSTLANLASRLQPQSGPTLFSVLSEPRTIQTGETTTLRWSRASQAGSYTFTFSCTEGVAISTVQADGTRGVSCDTEYNIGSNTELTLLVESEKQAYADVFFTIRFIRSQSAEALATAQGSFLVINETRLASATNDTESEITEPITPAEPDPAPETPVTPPSEPVVPEVSEPTPPNVTPPTPTPEPQFIYTIPASDPLGTPDLAARFLNTGTIANNRFSVGTLNRNQAGAVEFEVRNLGTKTSDTWTYTITAPGLTFTSPAQAPLRPSERAVLAVGFPGSSEQTASITVTVTTAADRTLSNNQFTQPVRQN